MRVLNEFILYNGDVSTNPLSLQKHINVYTATTMNLYYFFFNIRRELFSQSFKPTVHITLMDIRPPASNNEESII